MKIKLPSILTSILTVLSICGLLGGFSLWLLNQAEAQTAFALNKADEAKLEIRRVERKLDERDVGIRQELRQLREDTERRSQRIEEKLDRVLERIIKR